MQLFEVKNDIAKILYNPEENHLLPSDFLLIEDSNQKLIAQILTTQTTDSPAANLSIVRLALSIDKDDNVFLYNGYIPAKNSKIIYINSDEIIEFIKGTGINIYFGNLSNYPAYYVKPSISFLDEYLYIQSDRDDETETINYNILRELQNKKQNVILIDFDGKYNIDNCIRLKAGSDFKLPLNIEAFNTILDYDTVDCSIEEKTIIQSIILEVREYVNSLNEKFLPFNLFKKVVNEEFITSPSYGLMYFRNKLWEYGQDGLFAEDKQQFEILNSAFKETKTIIIDASDIHEKWYSLIIQTICTFLKEKCYFILSLEGIKADKKFIINLYKNTNITPVISTTYTSPSRKILKSICRNQVLCRPSCVLEEDEKYTVLLKRINENEMILYGQTTLYLPIPVQLKLFTDSTADDLIEYEIKKDVDKLLSSSQTVIPTEAVVQELTSEFIPNNYTTIEEDDLTDSDLDFLDEEVYNSEPQTETVTDVDVEQVHYEMFNPGQEIEEKPAVMNFSSEETNNIDSSKKNIENEINTSLDNNIMNDEEYIPENYDDISDIVDYKEYQEVEPVEKYENNESSNNIESGISIDYETNVNDYISDQDEKKVKNEPQEDIQEEIKEEIQEEFQEQEKEELIEEIEEEVQEQVKEELKEEIQDNVQEQEKEELIEEIEEEVQEQVKDELQNEIQEEVQDVQAEEKEEFEEETTIENDTNTRNETQNLNKKIEQKAEKKTENTIIPPKLKEKINLKETKEIPIYETEKSQTPSIQEIPFKVGDVVYHPKHGKGVIEGFANYSNKILFCQIEFENVGRRILDPRIAGIKKI